MCSNHLSDTDKNQALANLGIDNTKYILSVAPDNKFNIREFIDKFGFIVALSDDGYGGYIGELAVTNQELFLDFISFVNFVSFVYIAVVEQSAFFHKDGAITQFFNTCLIVAYVEYCDTTLDDFGDCELDLYMENLSGSTVNVYSGEIMVNGEAVSGYISKTLRSDTRAADRTYIYELDERVDLDIEELSQIEEITIDLYVEYMDGWDIVESHSESITFEPNAIV